MFGDAKLSIEFRVDDTVANHSREQGISAFPSLKGQLLNWLRFKLTQPLLACSSWVGLSWFAAQGLEYILPKEALHRVWVCRAL